MNAWKHAFRTMHKVLVSKAHLLISRGKLDVEKNYIRETEIIFLPIKRMWGVWRSRYSDWLRAGRSGDRIQVGARFSAPVQTGPGAHPASCTIGTGSFLGVKSGRGVTLTPHPLLVPLS